MMEWANSDKRDFQESVEYQHRIRKHKDRKNTTERQSKTYRFTYDKRVILKEEKLFRMDMYCKQRKSDQRLL